MKQAVLLAAGTGVRLMPLTADRPKCMVQVGGHAIVDTLLDALANIGISEIVVVTGYKDAVLRDYLQQRRVFSWCFIHNDRYETTNNILSLQLANSAIKAPFILAESDIYCATGLLEPLREPDTLLVAPYAAGMNGTGITVSKDDDGQYRGVEEMVIRAHESRAGTLTSMHKTVNLYSFSEPTWKTYREALNVAVAAGNLDCYYEAVLAELIGAGSVKMRAVDVGYKGWAEIDDLDDLQRLEARCQECPVTKW